MSEIPQRPANFGSARVEVVASDTSHPSFMSPHFRQRGIALCNSEGSVAISTLGRGQIILSGLVDPWAVILESIALNRGSLLGSFVGGVGGGC